MRIHTKHLVLASLLTALVLPLQAQNIPEGLENDQCLVCHDDFGAMPENYVPSGIHMKRGLSCAGCHGGDATSDDEEIAHSGNWVGIPKKGQIPQFCGKCHSDLSIMRRYNPSASTDQVSQYFTSVHGKKLLAGDQKVADCANCHTPHAVLPASDGRSSVHPLNVPDTCAKCHSDAETMSGYGIRTTQYRDYAQSVHGKALLERRDIGAPACNDCHGNHGAAPPEVASIEHVCGMCHVNNSNYFSETSMARAFETDDLHACEECHGIHDVAPTFDGMVGVGDDSTCTTCHDEGDDGYEAARLIGEQLGMLVTAQDSARVLTDHVVRIGMDDIELGFLQQDAHESLIQARTLVHTFDPERTGPKVEEGLVKAREAVVMAYAEIDQFKFRRFGFGIATLLITVLTVALFFKIREIDADTAEPSSDQETT